MKHLKITLFLVASLTAAYAGAFNPQPEPPPAAIPFSVGDDESLKVHMVNVADRLRLFLPEDALIDDGTCTATLTITDGTGRVVVATDGRVPPGEIRTLNFDARRLGIARGEFKTLTASIQFNGPVETAMRCNISTRASVEIRSGADAILGAVLEIPTSWASGIDPTPF